MVVSRQGIVWEAAFPWPVQLDEVKGMESWEVDIEREFRSNTVHVKKEDVAAILAGFDDPPEV
ncbi:hypothetical protein N9073_06220 [Akkermansiaceae bacterium]|nr:hypothetical protein [Akkermansiaceae bacterium]MDA7534064.1 hypothetical protein [bacterium]MDA7860266.1 hypothetical protein [Akkermansiaceae bacterium]MDA7870203.1 hypothetical protein [Akkermansiaceae bacterium]MDA7871249.1 hypothetical protein [Akkermansiaceae bacterium]